MAPVTINRNTIDLDARQHPHGYFPTDATESNYVLVQYSRVPTVEDHSRLDKLKATIIQRIADHTLLCNYLPSDLGPIRALPFVQHAAVYHPDFVVSPLVEHAKEKDGQIAVGVYVHLSCGKDGLDLWDTVRTTIDPDARLIGHSKWSAKLWIKPEKLVEVAALDQVWAIEHVIGCELHSQKACPRILDGGETWPGGALFDGTGEIVAVADTGYANGRPDGHPMLPMDRIVNMKYSGTGHPSTPYTVRDTDNHGTGAAACVAASWNVPSLVNAPLTQAQQLCSRLQGTAPGANLFIIRCFEIGQYDEPVAVVDNLWTLPYNDEGAVAKIINCSWGTRVPMLANSYRNIGYGAAERVMDTATIEDGELAIVFSAANKGAADFVNSHSEPILRQVVTNACAKNIITVGQTYNERWFELGVLPDGMRTWQGLTVLDGNGTYQTEADLNAAGAQGSVSRYFWESSRGPTESGILKPEVVAPGASILVASAETHDPLNASPVPNPKTCFATGTSFSAPFVAGIVADLRQALRNPREPVKYHIKQPPNMLIKALIVNGAQDLYGSLFQYWLVNGDMRTTNMPRSPNNAVGFGLVNLRRSLVPLTQDGGGIWSDIIITEKPSSTQEIHFPTTNPNQRDVLRVTLTWADIPDPLVVNYLQLRLQLHKSDGSNETRNADPLQTLDYEPNEPHPPDTRKQVVQRITLRDALASTYQSLTAEVFCSDPIIAYKGRMGQPFHVAWGFYRNG